MTFVEYRRINTENLGEILKLVQNDNRILFQIKKGKWLKFIPHFLHGKYYNYNIKNRNRADKAWL